MNGNMHILPTVAILLTLLPAPAAEAGPGRQPLFESAELAVSEGPAGIAQAPVLRQRAVRPRLEGMERAETLVLNLFEDETLVAERRHLVHHAPGRFTWFGDLRGLSPSYVALAVRDGRLVGHVGWELGHYRIVPSGLAGHTIVQIDASLLPPDGEPLEIEPPTTDSFDALAPDSGAVIDVLIAYTAASASFVGDIDAFVQLLLDETNQSYANSGIVQRVNLVFYGEVGYVETGSSVTDVLRLQDPNDGFMDEVHVWRDDYCADVVTLLAQDFDTCGLGFQMITVAPNFASNAFNLVRPGCAAGFFSYGHEMGHNMGCNHDHLSTSNPGAYPYSHGYVNIPSGWRTIMAILDGPLRLQYWSNPSVLYEGEPMGVPSGQSDPSDCRRTLDNTRSTVAKFRNSSGCVLRVPDGTLRVDRAGPDLTVSWEAACGVADDYTVYEGDLAGLASTGTYGHTSRVCTDQSADRSETFTPAPEDSYYLVVPRNDVGLEGAYGAGRPQGTDGAGCGITGHRPGGVCS